MENKCNIEETIYALPLQEAHLSVRSYNGLRRFGVDTIADLIKLTRNDIENIRGLGKKSIDEICDYIEAFDLDNILVTEDIYSWVSRNKETVKAYFQNNEVYLRDMELSVRSFNALRLNDLCMLSQFITLTEEELLSFDYMGKGTVKEIIQLSRYYLRIHESNLKGTASSKVGNISIKKDLNYYLNNSQYKDKVLEVIKLNDVLLVDTLSSVRAVNALAKQNIYKLSDLFQIGNDFEKFAHLGRKSIEDIHNYIKKKTDELEDQIIAYCTGDFSGLYTDSYIIKTVLSLYIAQPFKGISFRTFRMNFPEEIPDQRIKSIIGQMLKDQQLEYVDFRCYRRYPSFIKIYHHFNNFDQRNKELFELRLKGKTLQEVADMSGLTRERVRQIVAKSVAKIRLAFVNEYGNIPFDEDYYADLFKHYKIEKDFWYDWLNVSKETYSYLKLAYDEGKASPEKAVKDETLDVSIRSIIMNYLNRNKILLDGIYLEKKKSVIEEYVLQKFCKETMLFDEFIETYNAFLRNNNVQDADLFYNDDEWRTRANKFSYSNLVLWSEGKKLRYYNINGYDFTELLDTLNLSKYSNTEVSTLKFIKDYPELMEKYDIHNQYELHNLLRKIVDPNTCNDIDFNRQPILKFGQFDRSQMVLETLQILAPISLNDLVDYISDSYGYDKLFIQMGMLKVISVYYHKGIYSLDYKQMDTVKMDLLKEHLTEQFYTYDEVKKIYRELFPADSIEMLNSYNFKKMGFKVFTNGILQNCPSLEKYFLDILTEKEVYDVSDIVKRYSNISMFSEVYYELMHGYDYVEYEPKQLISIKRLEKLGISKEDIKEYCEEVYQYVDDEYFNVHSLRESGFESKLDDLGFGEWFYGSILKFSGLFKYSNVFNNIILRKDVYATQVSRESFIVHNLKEYESVELDDFLEEMKVCYGIPGINRYHVLDAIRDTEMYYDPIMEKVYLDKSFYYAEFDD